MSSVQVSSGIHLEYLWFLLLGGHKISNFRKMGRQNKLYIDTSMEKTLQHLEMLKEKKKAVLKLCRQI